MLGPEGLGTPVNGDCNRKARDNDCQLRELFAKRWQRLKGKPTPKPIHPSQHNLHKQLSMLFLSDCPLFWLYEKQDAGRMSLRKHFAQTLVGWVLFVGPFLCCMPSHSLSFTWGCNQSLRIAILAADQGPSYPTHLQSQADTHDKLETQCFYATRAPRGTPNRRLRSWSEWSLIAAPKSQIILCRDKKPMTATDVTGFYAFFSARKSAIFSTFWGHFLKLHSKPGEKGKNPLEKIQRNPVETAPRNCRILSLVVVERVLSLALFWLFCTVDEAPSLAMGPHWQDRKITPFKLYSHVKDWVMKVGFTSAPRSYGRASHRSAVAYSSFIPALP